MKLKNIFTPWLDRTTILQMISTSTLVTLMRMSLTKLNLTSQCKNDTPSYLGITIDLPIGFPINNIISLPRVWDCHKWHMPSPPGDLPQLPPQTHAYLLHSKDDSSSECLIPLPFSSSMVDLKALTIPSLTHFNAKRETPSTIITL